MAISSQEMPNILLSLDKGVQQLTLSPGHSPSRLLQKAFHTLLPMQQLLSTSLLYVQSLKKGEIGFSCP